MSSSAEQPPVLPGGMQPYTLNANKILDYATAWHPEQEIICKTPEGPITISTYQEVHKRAQLCSLALDSLGMGEASIVATLAWNTTRHFESWYGIMGVGGVVHTLNPRLSDKDLIFIMNDAQDAVIMSDITFVAQLSRVLPHVPSCKHVIFLTDRQNFPYDNNLTVPTHCYEELIGAQTKTLNNIKFQWRDVNENAACGLCYTSGTTGNPKGVMYTHRAQFLHTMVVVQVDAFPMRSSSCCMALVPMFHANSWGLVFALPLVGGRLVLPGPWLDGESVYNLMERFDVNFSAGVPTVWLNLLNYMEKSGKRLSTFRHAVIGGAAPARSLIETFEKKYGIEVLQMWGMTETAPLGSVSGVKAPLQASSQDQLIDSKAKQGRPHVLCDMRIIDDQGREVPHDGRSVGHLQTRGPHTVHTYFKHGKPAVDAEGWFSTGDIASIDKLGYMTITDRSKDVVKSGGEWISSIEIENLVMGHPAVMEAAVVAIPDDKWGERPLLVVVPRAERPDLVSSAEGLSGIPCDEIKEQLYRYLEDRLARYAIPDDIVFITEIPHNATGKVSKLTLRDMFRGHKRARARM